MAPLTTPGFDQHQWFQAPRQHAVLHQLDARSICQDGDPTRWHQILPAAEVITHAAPSATYDDFALDGRGDTFLVTVQGNSIEEIKRDGEPQVVIAGAVNSTEIAEPTAARFGRTLADREVLYVTNAERGGDRRGPIGGG